MIQLLILPAKLPKSKANNYSENMKEWIRKASVAYHAFKNGIVIIVSAGNDRRIGSVVKVAPYMITVAASTIYGKFINYMTLGSGYTSTKTLS
ncbi:hypothetical protein QYF36_006993 [Acer negundo]|nr:hypothetical protein QYF36_006993 [Acer negundo]